MNVQAQQPVAQPKTTSAPANGSMPEGPPLEAYGDYGAVAPAPAVGPKVFNDADRSQSTQVEQARAIAEVQAAVLVAQKSPRNVRRAQEEMREVCRIDAMADRAFFSFPRAGETVSGASIHLARELARIWGNIGYEVKELARNDAKGESEMLATAWDLQTNVRANTGFIVPHVRDTRSGRKAIKDVRDVYENNANMGARRVRECIFAVLPKWFTDEAEDLCRQTLEAGGGVPFEKRLQGMINGFAQLGVTREMIEKRSGCAAVNLTSAQLADLKIVFRSLKNGEIKKDEAFPETPGADVTKHLEGKAAAQEASSATSQQNGPQAAQTGQQAVQGAQASAPAPVDHSATVKVILEKIEKIGTVKGLDNIVNVAFAEDINTIQAEAPAAHAEIQAAIKKKRDWFAR